MKNFNTFIKKIKNKKIKVGVIGMGYVGLPLSILIAQKSFKVFGFDQDINKIKRLEKTKLHKTYIKKKLISVINKKNLIPTNNFNLLEDMDVIIICVPTPLSKKNYLN